LVSEFHIKILFTLHIEFWENWLFHTSKCRNSAKTIADYNVQDATQQMPMHAEFQWGLVLHWHRYGKCCIMMVCICIVFETYKVLYPNSLCKIFWMAVIMAKSSAWHLIHRWGSIYTWLYQQHNQLLLLDAAKSTSSNTKYFSAEVCSKHIRQNTRKIPS
jgi:hypothetical protein